MLTRLEERALEWIEPYWNAHHLVRARAWLLELAPEAGEALRLAALTHDMERHFPGGPVQDLAHLPTSAEDRAYRRAHARRSARIVGEWLREENASEDLVREVERLVAAHEEGGGPDEDLVQAADSLSFLETNRELMVTWFTSGRCPRERSETQLRWMCERIRHPRARELALPLYEEAVAVVRRA